MSGIAIPVDTQSTSARKDLDKLNVSLKQLAERGKQTDAVVSGVFSKSNFSKMTFEAERLKTSVKAIETATAQTASKVASAGAATASAIGKLVTGIQAAAIAFTTLKGAGVFNKLSDDLTRYENQLRRVTANTDDLIQRQKTILKIASEVPAGYASTVSLYAKFAKSLESSGTSTEDLANLTATVQKTVALFGGETDSIRAAVMQFGQALDAGILRGEEFNSLAEQLPTLLDAIAAGMGRTTGELRGLANDGVLSADVIKNALLAASKTVDADFAKSQRTAAEGIMRLRDSTSLFIGEISHFTGSAHAFFEAASSIANGLDDLSNNAPAVLANISGSFANFVYELENSSAKYMVAKRLFSGDIESSQAVAKRKEFEQMQRALQGYHKTLGYLGKVKEAVSAGFSIDAGGFITAINKISAVTTSFAYAFTGLFDKFDKLIPIVKVPALKLYAAIGAGFTLVTRLIDVETTHMKRQWMSTTQAYREYLTLFLIGDHELERAWINVARSKNLSELTLNFTNLGDALRNIRFNDWSIVFGDVRQSAKKLYYSFEDTLIALGFMQQRLITIDGLRFDRVAGGFRTLQSVVRTLYKSLFAQKIEIGLAYFEAAFDLIINSLLSNLQSRYGQKISEGLGHAFGSGLRSAALGIKNGIKDLVKIQEGQFEFAQLFSIKTDSLRRALKSVTDFFKGFVAGLIGRSTDAASESFGLMVNDISKHASLLLTEVADKIKRFTDGVKAVFFQAYDEVVGHSYWPDLIDGVNSYTSRLVASDTLIGKFTRGVTDKFKQAYTGVRSFLEGNALKLGTVTISVNGIDFGDMPDKVRRAIATVTAAGLLYAFGGPAVKLLIADYLSGLLPSAINTITQGISQEFFKSLSLFLVEGFGALSIEIVKGLLHMVGGVITMAPKFLDAAVSSLGGFGEYVSSLFEALPSSGLIAAALLGSGAALVLPGNEGLKSQIASFWNGTMTFVSSLAKGNNTVGAKLIGSPATLAVALAVFASSIYTSVSALEAALIGVPILLSAFIGADGTGRLLRETVLNFIPFLGKAALSGLARLNSQLRNRSQWYSNLVPDFTQFANRVNAGLTASAASISTGGRRGLRAALFDVISAVPDMLSNMAANKGLYAKGSISFADMFLDSSNSPAAKEMKKALDTAQKEATVARRTAKAAEADFRKASAEAINIVRAMQGAAIVTPNMAAARDARLAAARAAAVQADTARQAAQAADAAVNNARAALASVSSRIDIRSIFGNFSQEVLQYFRSSPILTAAANFFRDMWSSAVTSYNSGAIRSVIRNVSMLFTDLVGSLATLRRAAAQNVRGIWAEVASISGVLGGTFSAIIDRFRVWRAALLVQASAGGTQGLLARAIYGATGKAGFLAVMAAALSAVSFKVFAADAETSANKLKSMGLSALVTAAGLYAIAVAIRAFNAYTAQGLVGLVAFRREIVSNWAGGIIAAFGVVRTLWSGVYRLLTDPTMLSGFASSFSVAVASMQRAIVGLSASFRLLSIQIASVRMLFAFGWATGGVNGVRMAVQETALAANVLVAARGPVLRFLAGVTSFLAGIHPLAAALFAVAVGVVAVFLFGPEGSFMKKLNYYYDAVRSYFSDIEALYPRQKELMLAIPTREVAGRTIDFSAKIGKVDTEAMSARDFAGLLQNVNVTNETLNRYADITKKQGSLNEDQTKSLQKLIDQQDKVFSKAPRLNSIDDLLKGSEALQKEILGYSSTITAGFNRLVTAAVDSLGDPYNEKGYQDATRNLLNVYGMLIVGYRALSEEVIKDVEIVAGFLSRNFAEFSAWISNIDFIDPLTEAIKAAYAATVAALEPAMKSAGEVLSYVFEKAFDWSKVADDFKQIFDPSSIKDARKIAADTVRVNVEKVNDNKGLFTKPEIKQYSDTIDAYRIAQKKFDSALASNAPEASKEFKILANSLETARSNFERLSEAMARTAEIRLQAKIYKGNWEQVWQSVKETFGSDIGKELGFDLFFDTDTYKDGILDMYSLAAQKGKEATDTLKGKVFGDQNAIVDTTVALKYKLDRASAQKAMADMEETAKQMAFFDTQVEFAIKVSGADVAKEDVYEFFKASQEGFFTWMETIKDLHRLEAELSQLSLANPKDAATFEANKKRITEIIEKLPALRKAAQDAAPKKGLFEEFNARLSKISVDNLEMKPFAYMSESLRGKLIPALREAETAKDNLDKAKNKPYEAYIAALQEMLTKAEAVRSVIKDMKPPEVRVAEALGTNAAEVYALQGKRRDRAFDVGNRLADNRERLEDPAYKGDKRALAISILSDERAASKMFEKSAEDIFSRFSDAMQKKGVQLDLSDYVRFDASNRLEVKGLVEKMGAIRSKLNNAGGIYPSNEEWFRTQQLKLDQFQKRIEDIKERAAANSFDGVVEKISSSGYEINLDSAFGISDETLGNLRDVADTIDNIIKKLKDPNFKGDTFTLRVDLNDQRLKQKEIKRANSNFAEQFSLVKEQIVGLDISEEDFLSLPKGLQESIYSNAVRLARATDDAASVVGAAAIKAQASLAADKKLISKETNTAVSAALPVKYGAQLSTINSFSSDYKLTDVEFPKLATDKRAELFKAANALKVGAKELEDATGEAATIAARGLESAKKRFDSQIREAAVGIRSTPENLVAEASALGLSVDKALANLLDDTQIKMFRDLAEQIRAKQKLVNETADASVRQLAQAEVWNLRDKFEEAFRELAVKPSETPMAQQAKAFASSVVSSVETSVVDVLKGKMSLKDGIAGILESFTGGIIDSFVKGLTSPFTGESGVVTRFFRDLGSNIFGEGQRLASANAPEDVSTTLSEGFSGLTNFLAPMATTFSSMLGLDTAGVSVQQAQLAYLGTLGVSIPAAVELSGISITAAITTSTTSIVSAITSSAASSGVGLFGGLFAEGGRISGPGTGTSDSIAALLSNGEYVINASATKANLPLLEAINSGRLPRFAEGGLAGSSMVAVPAYVPVESSSGHHQNSQVFNINITGDISQQTRREIYGMLPAIATGVNQYNRERK